MNVFVLCTGRCGSHTFARACSHAANYSAGHETHTRLLGDCRLAYPERHIEVDNRLSWFLGRLDEAYGKEAFYVHLVRNSEAVAASYAPRTFSGGIMKGYYESILMYLGKDRDDHPNTELWTALARDYVETVNRNIQLFLRDKPRTMTFHLESALEDFQRFWRVIGADGDLGAALGEWHVRHDVAPSAPEHGNLAHRARRRLVRLRRGVLP